MPKVSIIIPVYNVEKYLKECLCSLVNQTLKDIEIICVDDGSTDNSLNILEDFAQKDSRIIVLTQKNQGAAIARNKGLDIAKGEYLSILDSDDFFKRDMLEKMYYKAKAFDCETVICKAKSYDEKTKSKGRLNNSLNDGLISKMECFSCDDIANKVFQLTIGFAWNKLFKGELVRSLDLKFQNLKNTNDFYFTYLLLMLSNKIVVMQDEFVTYRLNVDSSTTQRRKLKSFSYAKNYVKAANKLKREMIKRNIYEKFEQSFANRCVFDLIYILRISNKDRRKLKKFLKEYYFKNLGVENKPKEFFYNNLYDRIQEFYHPVYRIKKIIQRLIVSIKIQYN